MKRAKAFKSWRYYFASISKHATQIGKWKKGNYFKDKETRERKCPLSSGDGNFTSARPSVLTRDATILLDRV
jgi:hypothetical protein